MTTASIMTSRVITLRADDKVIDALRTMHQYHIRNLPVVDDNGSFVGLFGVCLRSSCADYRSCGPVSDLREELLAGREARWRQPGDLPAGHRRHHPPCLQRVEFDNLALLVDLG